MTLQCNVISHWLSPYPEWSLYMCVQNGTCKNRCLHQNSHSRVAFIPLNQSYPMILCYHVTRPFKYNEIWLKYRLDLIGTRNHGCQFNALRLRQNSHFPDDTLKWIFLNENVWISVAFSLKFVPKGPINNIPELVQLMAWCWPGNNPLCEPMMVSLLPHICITWPQRVKKIIFKYISYH